MFYSGLPAGRLHEAFIEAMATKRRAFFVNFIQTPVVLVGLLAVAFGIDYLIALCKPFYLPPSVVTTLVVFAILLLLSACSPKEVGDVDDVCTSRRKYVTPVLAVIEKPCDLILKHMSVCFTPAFILIPAGQTIAPAQIGLLTAFFFASFIVVFGVSISIHRLAGLLPFFQERTLLPDVEAAQSPAKDKKHNKSRTTVAVKSVRPSGATTPSLPHSVSRLSFANTISPEMELELAARDWPRRESDATLVNVFPRPSFDKGATCADVEEGDIGLTRPSSPTPTLCAPSVDLQPTPNAALEERCPTPFPTQQEEEVAVQDQAKQRLAEEMSTWMDVALYAVVALIALPVFYTTRVSVPLFLACNILIYLLVIRLTPPALKKFFHPIITTAFFSFFIIWAFGASLGWTLQQTLAEYSTPVDYIEIWTAPVGTSLAPGAGDLLVDGLDAGIIALALPLYRFRADLKKYFFRLIVLIIPSAVLSLFVWPLGARAFQLDSTTALAFVGRFSSTPLAVAQVSRVGGDEAICVVIVVVTGICFVILQPLILRALRVADDDFLTTGLLSGVTSGAIGASGLLTAGKERAAAIASLTFALFGTVILVLVGIPPVSTYIQMLMGLP